MRLDRLVVESTDGTLALDLHPRLTVVAGTGPVERERLVGEAVAALAGTRPGVHAELTTAEGRRLAVFRPVGSAHRVVDVDLAIDVSDVFRTPDGRCDLLEVLGLDAAAARRLLRLDSSDLDARDPAPVAAAPSAGPAPTAPGEAAPASAAPAEANPSGAGPSEAGPATPGTAGGEAAADAAERRHRELAEAAARFERLRRAAFYAGGASGLGTIPAVLAFGRGGLALVALALAGAFASITAWRATVRASRAEADALAQAGATSYLGLQLQRVDDLLAPASSARPVADHHEAGAPAERSPAGPGGAEGLPEEVTEPLAARVAAVGSVGDEGLPLLLDDPFRGVDASLKALLLEQLSEHARASQIVLLTDDEDIESWARLEALTGEVAVVELAPGHDRGTPHRVHL